MPKRTRKTEAKREQEGFLRANYKKSFVFLGESKAYIVTIALIFILSALAGLLSPFFVPDLMLNAIKELVEKTEGMSPPQLFVFIFQNNITNIFFGMLLGIVLGIFPVVITLFNGYFTGFVAGKAADASGYIILLKLIPHGIFELPALVIAMAVGARFGMFLFTKNKKENFLYCLENLLRIFLFIILPLLLTAAIIETGAIFFFR
ncbi:stage II sporulation protein M [Candidatus Pacearchaeota archaeon]|nr:stage II sporulation protein M [Candidatus Pacearchaeota archaeon]